MYYTSVPETDAHDLAARSQSKQVGTAQACGSSLQSPCTKFVPFFGRSRALSFFQETFRAHPDYTAVTTRILEVDMGGLGNVKRQALAPLDDRNALAGEELLQAERRRVARSLQAVQVDVVDRAPPRIDVDERERGARHERRILEPEASGQPPRERRLSDPEGAAEQDHASGPEAPRQRLPERR